MISFQEHESLWAAVVVAVIFLDTALQQARITLLGLVRGIDPRKARCPAGKRVFSLPP